MKQADTIVKQKAYHLFLHQRQAGRDTNFFFAKEGMVDSSFS